MVRWLRLGAIPLRASDLRRIALVLTAIAWLGHVSVRAADEPAPQTKTGVLSNLQPFLSSSSELAASGNMSPVVTSAAGNEVIASSTANGNSSIAGTPGAVNIVVGSGKLGDALGVNQNGWRLGGLTINDANGILVGGLGPGRWAGQNLTIADLTFDAEEAGLWQGGMFGTEFLYYTGYGAGPVVNGIEQNQGSPNSLAGSVMGFNSLDGKPPIHRAELYELWYRQSMCDDALIVRVGKSIPTYDFGNVVKPARMQNSVMNIPATSGALLAPLYVNPTMLGIIPGYYNSATGIVITVTPSEFLYLQYGFFDGNLPAGSQTGMMGPQFNGHYFHIGEVGVHWGTAEDELPGRFGIGYWGQTGPIETLSNGVEYGAQGVYFFGSQRLTWEDPGVSNNGLSSYYQFGASNNDVVVTQRFFGCGLTYHGLLDGRDNDSAGFAMAWGQMTDDPNAGKIYFKGYPPGPAPVGSHEVILTWYYQIEIKPGMYLQPNLTYIPDPARVPDTPAAFPFTLQSVVLF
jgi:porin